MPVVLVAEQALLMRDYLILTTNKTKVRRGVFCGKGLFMGIILPGAGGCLSHVTMRQIEESPEGQFSLTNEASNLA